MTFAMVSLSVLILRKTHQRLERGFGFLLCQSCRLFQWVSCLFLMLNLPGRTWLYFGVVLIGVVVMYAAYSNKHSELARNLHEKRCKSVDDLCLFHTIWDKL
ncbi:hypothetical protein ACEQPO_01345 [Bacillus sp. SL00103]